MKAEEIRANLNRRVLYRSVRTGVNAEYLLTGAIFRRGENGFYYQAELTDPKTNKSILICSLNDIEVIQ